MIQLSGIFSESLGGTCTIRGYAKYNEIVELSYPHPGYQRPAEDEHVAEISSLLHPDLIVLVQKLSSHTRQSTTITHKEHLLRWML